MVFEFFVSAVCCLDYRLSMDTSGKRIALGTILLLVLLCLAYLSIAHVIYRPVDLFSIDCGSSTNLSSPDGRNWIGDSNTKLLSDSQNTVAAPALTETMQDPYTTARLSRSQFTYSFPVTAGPKFLRLFFYSTSYQNFDRSKAYFSVKAGPYILLQHFNASLDADADDDPDDFLFREYCINLENGQRLLNISFIPSTTDSYAFINGIEIVSMPPYLYYSNPDYYIELPQLVGTTSQYVIENNLALQTMYRLTVAGASILPSWDTGMLRTWDPDDKYLTGQSGPSVDFANVTKLSFIMIPNYTAPDQVYRTVRNIETNASMNLTWQLPVDSGYTYLLRLHFCQLFPLVRQAGDFFYIFIQDQLVEDYADILVWSNEQKGVPVVRDYAVMIPRNQEKAYLSLKMHPHPYSLIKDAQLNAIELFKINDPAGNLAGLNPVPPLQISKVPLHSSNKKTLAAIIGAVSSVILLFFIVTFFLIKLKKNLAVNKGSNKKDKTSPTCASSSSLPVSLCRHFSIVEIKVATNNFDEVFVLGVGGFGNVYKGYIDHDSTRVAVKRLKPGSRQGEHEFENEIEMLSRLSHPNVVFLIGYCYESNEMVVVYEFMDRGNLRDHLYDTDNPSLSWKQRLQICIGVAQGLHYLHTGAKQVIIHRDVKSTNILLDEKWVAKVSDFGLARIWPTGMAYVNTEVKGSSGYLDPEYYKRHRLTEKSDVYSFGVVLLEVLSGRPPLLHWEEKQRMSLVNWAKHCYEKGTDLSEIVDAKLKGQIAPRCLQKFGEVALSCLLEDGTQRPSMNDVVGVLEFVLHLQLQDTVLNEVEESGGNCEDSKNV